MPDHTESRRRFLAAFALLAAGVALPARQARADIVTAAGGVVLDEIKRAFGFLRGSNTKTLGTKVSREEERTQPYEKREDIKIRRSFFGNSRRRKTKTGSRHESSPSPRSTGSQYEAEAQRIGNTYKQKSKDAEQYYKERAQYWKGESERFKKEYHKQTSSTGQKSSKKRRK